MSNHQIARQESFVRFVYERGLQLLRSDAGWLIPSSGTRYLVASPEELEERFAVRKVTAYRDVAPFLYPRQVFDPEGGVLSRHRYLAGYVETSTPLRIYKQMVEHYLFTTVTHLAYLAEAYAGLAVLKNHSEWKISEDTVVTSSRQLYNSALLHAESVFAGLHSAMSTTRYVIWRRRGEPPDPLTETIAIAELEDPALGEILRPLEDVWDIWADRLAAYRDCGARYNSEEHLGGRSGGELVVDDIWEIYIDLPDNPLDDTDDFTFANDVDALELAWSATTDVVRAIEFSVPRVYQRAVALEREIWS